MTIDFSKNADGLVPAIIQDNSTQKVLMLGYLNDEAYKKTIQSKRVTFYSRSKRRLWTKGEESGNFLNVIDIKLDCDQDTILVQVCPEGPVCHLGHDTCWNEDNKASYGFLSELESTIENRKENQSAKDSYVASLFRQGINKIAQKVGEEAVETVIEAKDTNDELFLDEAADLLFHFMILLKAKDHSLDDVVTILKKRS